MDDSSTVDVSKADCLESESFTLSAAPTTSRKRKNPDSEQTVSKSKQQYHCKCLEKIAININGIADKQSLLRIQDAFENNRHLKILKVTCEPIPSKDILNANEKSIEDTLTGDNQNTIVGKDETMLSSPNLEHLTSMKLTGFKLFVSVPFKMMNLVKLYLDKCVLNSSSVTSIFGNCGDFLKVAEINSVWCTEGESVDATHTLNTGVAKWHDLNTFRFRKAQVDKNNKDITVYPLAIDDNTIKHLAQSCFNIARVQIQGILIKKGTNPNNLLQNFGNMKICIIRDVEYYT